MHPIFKIKAKPQTGVMVHNRAPDTHDQEQPETEENDHSAAIEACAKDLIDAVHNRDVKAVADALNDAFTILDSMPHEEGEHTEPHSYDAQNQKAAKEEE